MWTFLVIPLLCFLTFLFGIYVYFKRQYKYWEKRGLWGPEPSFPVGNLQNAIFNKKHDAVILADIYKRTKDRPYVGIYIFSRPTILINDLEMIKTILVKDFAHFTDHPLAFNRKHDPLNTHLFNTNGSHWRGLRVKLSPAFTSNKMKNMFEIVAECGRRLSEYPETDSVISSEIDVKDMMARYTTDVIVSCALGIESNSLQDPNAEFRQFGKKLFNFDLRKTFILFLNLFSPDLLEKLPLSFTDRDITEFFTNKIYNLIKYREENKVVRNDIMHLLIRLKNNESIEDNDEVIVEEGEFDDVRLDKLEIAAQAFGFYVAGFETSAVTTSYILYELSANPKIQEELRNEIKNVLEKHDNKISYDALKEMTYLTQVIEETLRKHPPFASIFRKCTKEYTIPGTNILIDKGTHLLIPTLGIHYDPDIYPDPEKFDPSRFSPENKATRPNFSFLTFGEGPRICIGMRFAYMQMRVALVSLLSNYEVQSTESSRKGLVIDSKNFVYAPIPFFLKLSKIH